MDSLSSVASTVTPLLASQIERATRALALAHLLTPVAGESFINHEDALKRLQDWAFTQGFAVVTESVRKGRVIFQCIHHRKKTRNTRKPAGEGGRLTKQKEIQVLLQYLEDHQFHTQVRYEHAVDENGVRTGTRIVQDVFFISDA